ncbi:Signal transducer and activator of transcription [Trichinella pseudospiralis]
MACDQLKTVFINSSRLFSTTPHWSVADILRFSPESCVFQLPAFCQLPQLDPEQPRTVSLLNRQFPTQLRQNCVPPPWIEDAELNRLSSHDHHPTIASHVEISTGGDESLSQGAVVVELRAKEKCGVGNRLNGKRPQAKLPAILQAIICK